MADYIKREDVLECIKESRDGIDWGQSEDGDAFLHYSACLYRTIASNECFPSADVQPVVHGEWEKITGMAPPEYHWHYSCSECGWFLRGFYSGNKENSFNFCPNCGARMGMNGGT